MDPLVASFVNRSSLLWFGFCPQPPLPHLYILSTILFFHSSVIIFLIIIHKDTLIVLTLSLSVTFHFPKDQEKMKTTGSNVGGTKRKMWSRGVGGVIREQKAKLYIIRRCVVMLLCWHD
ncbi:unnamed protein product [Eruca vesicaria subsp. sativa]|uniref:Uncharacterized protein n=1 Tax=Eruca vesicaria subsp. sativa TaxID=29727 RepID=A0ABC8L2T8_ERUVS|nr:unnamed protein product [Eruca vesicaria subsp. sativa]